jgi:hypothetical protein
MKVDGFSGFVSIIIVLALLYGAYQMGKKGTLG